MKAFRVQTSIFFHISHIFKEKNALLMFSFVLSVTLMKILLNCFVPFSYIRPCKVCKVYLFSTIINTGLIQVSTSQYKNVVKRHVLSNSKKKNFSFNKVGAAIYKIISLEFSTFHVSLCMYLAFSISLLDIKCYEIPDDRLWKRP